MADRKISDLTALTAPASGDYLPIVDISEAAAASKNKRITIEELFRGVPLGTAAAPSIAIEGDEDTGVYSPGANQLAISTGGSGRITIDGSGNVNIDSNTLYVDATNNRVGVGTTSPVNRLTTDIVAPTSSYDGINLVRGSSATGVGLFFAGSSYSYGTGLASGDAWLYSSTQPISIMADGASSTIKFSTGGNSERVRIDSSGRVGIGTTSPAETLHLGGTSGQVMRINGVDTAAYFGAPASNIVQIASNRSPLTGTRVDGTRGASFISLNATTGGGSIDFATASGAADASTKATIDSSGRLLIGTSTARGNVFYNGSQTANIQGEATGFAGSALSLARNENSGASPTLILAKTRGTSLNSVTLVSSNDELGKVTFQGADGTDFVEAAQIRAEVDGTPGANDMPGRLVFSTTADGASSPTERMRIGSDGWIYASTTSRTLFSDTSGNGLTWSAAELGIATTANAGLYINRTVADGDLIRFYQAGTQEGAISVSGTTVTYGGGHLARWSQLPNSEDPSLILKGTVMSNLDEMCDWGDEDNEQLNKTKVSDVEGDKNVAGVFVSNSFSDDGPLDFFVGMTGDMVIRIAEGVTVERGDLLMSAGDGTAKPQDDDIIRSKTIAKVTSTNVSCTYADGSYCVPCVLMAC